MVIVRVCPNHQPHVFADLNTYIAKVVQNRNLFGHLVDTRINDDPFASTDVNGDGLSLARAEYRDFDFVWRWWD